jgi:hypothetical protein
VASPDGRAFGTGPIGLKALQMPSDCDTNVAAMPGDENAHATMISPRSN